MEVHVKLVSETSIRRDAPKSAYIDGRFVCGTLPEAYLNSQGWYRLTETPMPEPRTGYHYEQRFAYDSDEAPTAIVQSWLEVEDPPAPPRTFSKLKLKMALAQAGLLQQFLDVLQGVELIEGSGYMASDAFADAVNLSEANDGFKAAVQAAKNELGVTDEDVERILAASVAD